MRLALPMFALAASTLLTAGCFGRANPRVKEITQTRGDSTRTTSFSYDDSGRVVEVEQVEVDREFQETIELEWEGALLVKLTRIFDSAGNRSEEVTELTYEGDRLVEATADDGFAIEEISLSYDDGGRIEEVDARSTFEGGSSRSTRSFEYLGGALVAFSSSFRFNIGDTVSESEDEIEIEHKDGRPVVMTLTAGDNVITLEASYADGALDSFDVEQRGKTNTGEPFTINGSAVYEYDSAGRLDNAVFENDGSPEELVIEIDYEDGDASGLDVTSFDALFFGLWDMKGAGYGAHDPKTQAARFLGASW
jgi:hypothetical protein